MSHDYTEAELDSMTPEERASVDLELNDKGPSDFVDEAEVAEKNAAKIASDDAAAAKKIEDDAAAAAAADAEAKRVADAANPLVKQEEPKPEPVAEAKLDLTAAAPFVATYKAPIVTDEQFADQQAALTKQFEDGELTVPQYQAENNKITMAKAKSDIAVQGASQAEQQTWDYQQDLYFAQPGNAILRDDPRFWSMMQAQLEVLYSDDANKGKSNIAFLTEAGTEVKKLLGLDGSAPAKAKEPELPKKKPSELDGVKIPKTLEGIPSADANNDKADTGEFAHMEGLEGMEYEFAYARMSKEQQQRFLAI